MARQLKGVIAMILLQGQERLLLVMSEDGIYHEFFYNNKVATNTTFSLRYTILFLMKIRFGDFQDTRFEGMKMFLASTEAEYLRRRN